MTTTLADTATSEALTRGGVTLEAVEAISTHAADTPFAREQRLAAWAAYDAIPMPSSRDERWRFTSLRGLDMAKVPALSAVPASSADAVQAWVERVAGEETGQAAARLVHANGQTVTENALAAKQLPDGVVYCSLERALREHPELVERHWGSAVSVAGSTSVDDKFAALQGATFAGGAFVYVPRNVSVDLTLHADVLHAGDGAHVSWRSLVVLEEGAHVRYVEEHVSVDGPESGGFSNAVVELVVGQGARLEYVTVQDYAVPMSHFATHRVLAERDSQVEWTAVGLGASRGKSRMEARLLGPGANVRLNGAYVLDGRQQLDYDTQQVHEAPNSYSDLAFKGVLSDRAHSVWRGIIDVRPGAQGTDSYQENRNLLLSKGAHADSIPGLQIEANEVRCTHGATISKVDPEQLFYLQARGIHRDEATRTIVQGFLTPLLDRVHPESVRDTVRDLLWARLERLGE
jgi:Fe-S cluster assembly protein SufD